VSIEIDYLNIEHLFLNVKLLQLNRVGYLALKGDDERVKIVKERIGIATVKPGAVSGW
jgi:hypothetical protein